MKKIARNAILVGSGKGGVGKSTVTINLGVALARQGLSVGVLDADLYGPSIPVMTGLRELSPQTTIDREGFERIIPLTKFGVQIMSLGFFLEEARSVLWRGPMLHGMLQKMVYGVEWGELDILLVDLPPGTGDVPLSLSQLIEIEGALVVATPQQVAVVDAVKAINSFDQLSIPVLGVIENMAGFTVPETNTTHAIFGEGKAQELAHNSGLPLLGSIPLIPGIRQGGDEGYPSAYHSGDNEAGAAFLDLATAVMNLLNERVKL